MNLCAPPSPSSLQGIDASKGPINISYKRNVSAPYCSTISSGLTTFPLDLDIFSWLEPKIIPWFTNFWNGSLVGTTPKSYKNLCQKRAYNKCNTACSAPPTYKFTGNHSFNFS